MHLPTASVNNPYVDVDKNLICCILYEAVYVAFVHYDYHSSSSMVFYY